MMTEGEKFVVLRDTHHSCERVTTNDISDQFLTFYDVANMPINYGARVQVAGGGDYSIQLSK